MREEREKEKEKNAAFLPLNLCSHNLRFAAAFLTHQNLEFKFIWIFGVKTFAFFSATRKNNRTSVQKFSSRVFDGAESNESNYKIAESNYQNRFRFWKVIEIQIIYFKKIQTYPQTFCSIFSKSKPILIILILSIPKNFIYLMIINSIFSDSYPFVQ